MRTWLLCGLLAAAVPLAGCDALGYGLWVVMPRGDEKVPAEFGELPGSKVAVVVYTDRRTDFEYPTARGSIAYAVTAELKRRLEDVEVVDPQRILLYQESDIRWDSRDRTEIGRKFGADYVLWLHMLEYSMRDPGSVHLYRGKIAAEADVYRADAPEREARVWRSRDLIRAEYPESGPIGRLADSDADIAALTLRKFADRLVKKFYRHKPEETEE